MVSPIKLFLPLRQVNGYFYHKYPVAAIERFFNIINVE